jgi:hypothetical protein
MLIIYALVIIIILCIWSNRQKKITPLNKSIDLISASVDECETVLSFLLTEYIAPLSRVR